MTLGDFTKQAESYRLARPSYPDALVDLLIDDAGIAAGDPVADFGAGTGIFTRLIIERGFRVCAIEPNQEMRSRHDASGAHWIDGTFEMSRLADASQRWAVAAQAFHWADPQKSLPEIRRVLQSHCIFTILWNNRAVRESEILTRTEEAVRKHIPEFDEAYRHRPWQTILESTGDFAFEKHRAVTHVVRMSKSRYLELWRSHNRLTTIAGPERFGLLVKDIEGYLDRLDLDEVDVPYRCEAWSARRRD